jgi:hypothetical protein
VKLPATSGQKPSRKLGLCSERPPPTSPTWQSGSAGNSLLLLAERFEDLARQKERGAMFVEE